MPGFIDLRPGLQLNVMPGHEILSASYQSVIRQVLDDAIRIDQPRRDDDLLTLQPGDAVTLVLQLHGRMYTCISKVRDVQAVPRETVLLDAPTEVSHGERRQFYRLFTNITPLYAARTDAEGEEIERLAVRIVDLSGGGVQLRIEQWIPVGSRVRLVFDLEDDPLQIDVTVLALAVQRPDTRRSFYRVNGRFAEISRDMQERIIRYIFRQQMLLRQKKVV